MCVPQCACVPLAHSSSSECIKPLLLTSTNATVLVVSRAQEGREWFLSDTGGNSPATRTEALRSLYPADVKCQLHLVASLQGRLASDECHCNRILGFWFHKRHAFVVLWQAGRHGVLASHSTTHLHDAAPATTTHKRWAQLVGFFIWRSAGDCFQCRCSACRRTRSGSA